MAKTVTIRLEDKKYKVFRKYASSDNRTLSNFIETATMRYIEENEFVDDFEMEEIRNNKELNLSIKRGLQDIKNKKVRRIG